MKDLWVLLAHLLTTIAKLIGPGGTRAVVADSLLVKQQLLVMNRSRRRAPGLSALDRFLLGFWVLVVMDQFTRRIIGFGVHAGDVDGVALCRMFNTAISATGVPEHLSSDNDPLFRYHQWQANLRIFCVDEIKTIPYTPISHPFVERLIGTIRREYLDHILF